MLFRYGFSLQETLDYLALGNRNTVFADRAEHMAACILSGGTLSHAMAQHSRYFSAIVCRLIHDAEAHGDLRETLARIVEFLDREASYFLSYESTSESGRMSHAFSFEIDGLKYAFELILSSEGVRRLSHSSPTKSHETLCHVVSSAALFKGLDKLLGTLKAREGMVFEAPASFTFQHEEEPGVLEAGVTVSYMDDEWLVVTEEFFSRFVVAFVRGCLKAFMDLGQIEPQEAENVRTDLEGLHPR